MEHNAISETYSRLAGNEILGLLWNMIINFCVHTSPPLNPILIHWNPVHTLVHKFRAVI
jgi:hypothetical protein